MEDLQTMDKASEPIMSVKDWVITLIVLIIPLVNLIMLFVWAFGDGTVKTKSNFAKAQLLMYLIFIALAFIFSILLASLGLFAGGFPMDY
ncbi:MAG TPA: hypothetical protein VK050_02930 [Flavobacteriaceae bacterium]|nr:hypothetical protein [Flavobacteriaceae bacterium]